MVLSKIATVIQSDLIHDTIKSERYFIVYGIFLNANFLFFDFLKTTPSGMSLKSNIFLKYIISLLGCGLILKDFWLIKLKNFKIIYWHLTLLISLSFYFPLMLFNNQSSSLFKLYNLLAIIILTSFIRIILFAIIYILGITAAYLFYRYETSNPNIDNVVIMLLVTSFILAMIYQIIIYQWQIISLIKKNNSKIKIHNHDLAKKNTELQQIIITKNEFMNKLTYRLSNFINNLTVTAKVLLNLWEDLSDNERYHQFYIIVKFSDKLNYSVNDISFLIKNTAQTISLNCSKINLAELINEVVAQSKIFYLNNGLWINKEIANNIDYTILIDKKMISKVLNKLIAYSVNHSVSPNILETFKLEVQHY